MHGVIPIPRPPDSTAVIPRPNYEGVNKYLCDAQTLCIATCLRLPCVRGSIVSAIQSWIFYGVEVADVETSSVGTIEGAWLSFDAWMMTVLVDVEERPALSVARYSMVLVATEVMSDQT
jgi:hypothetical protein